MNESLIIMKALSDSTRMRIINILNYSNLYVCEIVEILELPQSTISRHLTILRQANLIVSNKEGLWINYSLLKKDVYNIYIKNLITEVCKKEMILINDLSKTKNRIAEKRGCLGACGD